MKTVSTDSGANMTTLKIKSMLKEMFRPTWAKLFTFLFCLGVLIYVQWIV